MIVQIVRAVLLADPAVVALLGDRLYPVQLPEASTFPAGVITKASGVGEYTLDGDSGIARSRIQIDLYGEGYAAVVTIKRAVRHALSAFRGSPPSMSGCVIQSATCINDMDFGVPETERAAPILRRRMLEFNIFHKEN